MNRIKNSAIACLLNVLAPGLGFVHISMPDIGISLWLLHHLLVVTALCVLPYLLNTDRILVSAFITLGALGWIFRIGSSILTTFVAYQKPDQASPNSLKRWLAYIGVIAASGVIMSLTSHYQNIGGFKFPSTSMMPGFLMGDRAIVNKIAFRIDSPQRGDIVTFIYPQDTTVLMMKRVLGLPGDVIYSRNNKIFVNGNDVNEPYAVYGPVDRETQLAYPSLVEFDSITIAPNHFFLLGDNRNESLDSRIFGALDMELIRGKAICGYSFWPPKVRFFEPPSSTAKAAAP